jgi:hypothetical protein
MIAEQTILCRYNATEQEANGIEIQMRVFLRTPSEDPYPSVTIAHLYDPIFPEAIQDECFQRLNNGVNAGIWLSSIPVSPYSVDVAIVELTISPSPQTLMDRKANINLGYLLEVTISGIVEILRRNLENLRSGAETYLEWPEPPSDDEDDSENME